MTTPETDEDYQAHMRQMLECFERYCVHVLSDHITGEDWGCSIVVTRAGHPEATILCAINTTAPELIEGLQFQEDHQDEIVVEDIARNQENVTRH